MTRGAMLAALGKHVFVIRWWEAQSQSHTLHSLTLVQGRVTRSNLQGHTAEILWLRHPTFLWPEVSTVWVARQERSDGRGLPMARSVNEGNSLSPGRLLTAVYPHP